MIFDTHTFKRVIHNYLKNFNDIWRMKIGWIVTLILFKEWFTIILNVNVKIRIKNEDSDTHTFQRVIHMKNEDSDTHTFQSNSQLFGEFQILIIWRMDILTLNTFQRMIYMKNEDRMMIFDTHTFKEWFTIIWRISNVDDTYKEWR